MYTAIPVVEIHIQGYKDPIDFCIKVKCFRGFFDGFLKMIDGPILINKPFQTSLVWKVPIVKSVFLIKTNSFSSSQSFDERL